MKKWKWFSANCLNARLLCFKMIWDLTGHVYFNIFLISAYQIIFKTTICYFNHLFSSSDTHQSHHLDGYQAMGENSSFIFAFWAVFDNHRTTY